MFLLFKNFPFYTSENLWGAAELMTESGIPLPVVKEFQIDEIFFGIPGQCVLIHYVLIENTGNQYDFAGDYEEWGSGANFRLVWGTTGDDVATSDVYQEFDSASNRLARTLDYKGEWNQMWGPTASHNISSSADVNVFGSNPPGYEPAKLFGYFVGPWIPSGVFVGEYPPIRVRLIYSVFTNPEPTDGNYHPS